MTADDRATGGRKVIKRARGTNGDVRLTFAVEDDRRVSLVCDANGWDPLAHPLVKRANGTRSAAVVVQKGTTIRFRYLADGGDFYDDPDADRFEDNGMGSHHGVVVA
jgi:1,4-alpha-glucan branching enzyme